MVWWYGTYRVLEQREVAEHVLVGHLYGVRALRSDALDGAAHVQRALRAQPRRADVQRQERAWYTHHLCILYSEIFLFLDDQFIYILASSEHV